MSKNPSIIGIISPIINTLILQGGKISCYFPKKSSFHEFERHPKGKLAKALKYPKLTEVNSGGSR